MVEKRLRRSTANKILGGLCGGLGEYFNIDPTIIRLIWVLAIFWMGIPAIVAYFVGLIVISITGQKEETVQEEPVIDVQSPETVKHQAAKTSNPHLIWGWLIIGLGVIILMESLGYFQRVKEYIFPGALIIAGVWVLVTGFRRK
jgi:phage shock protein C